MKGIYLIVFLASWTLIIASKLPISYEAEDECPVPDDCPPKLISHEISCSKYYECENSQKQLRSCMAGLYFSKKWHGCVSREISDCPIGDCDNDGELLEHECKCTKFYECKNGRKALHECRADHHFNPTTKTCEPGKECLTQPTPVPCPEGKLIPHECQCTKYYECKRGRKALRECKKGTHFDEELQTCIAGEDCNGGNCTNGETKKHECDCDKYYKCTKNDWLLEYCPNDEHFSETQKRCMDPIDAGCENPPPGYCSPTSSPPKWAHECDCRLYYQCEERKKKIYECDWGSYFDDVNLICDVSENGKICTINNLENL